MLKLGVAFAMTPLGKSLLAFLTLETDRVSPMMIATADTEELLSKAKAGNLSAINQLMSLHQGSLHQMVGMRLDKRIQRRVDVSDVVQDVLVEASRRLKTYLESPVIPFHLWLRQIAKDRMIDSYRRHRVSAKRSVDREQQLNAPRNSDQSSMDLARLLADEGVNPEDNAIRKETARKVRSSIAMLPERDAEVINMRHYQNLSNQEIGNLLELSEPAASMRYLRAIRRLRELMMEDVTDEQASSHSYIVN